MRDSKSFNKTKKRRINPGSVHLFIICIIIVALVSSILIYNYGTKETFTGKLVQTYVDRGNTFFVFQKNDGTKESFENEDTIFFLKFNSRDFLTNTETGKTYEVTTNGWRIPILSINRNIINIKVPLKN